MQMNPVPTLMCIIFYANLGGALTLIGDPPNVIIGTNKDVIACVSSPILLFNTPIYYDIVFYRELLLHNFQCIWALVCRLFL